MGYAPIAPLAAETEMPSIATVPAPEEILNIKYAELKTG